MQGQSLPDDITQDEKARKSLLYSVQKLLRRLETPAETVRNIMLEVCLSFSCLPISSLEKELMLAWDCPV